MAKKRIATLYQKDKSLRIMNYSYKELLPYSNFLSFMRDYQNYASSFCIFNQYNGRRNLEISVRDNSLLETHKVDYGCYSECKATPVSIGNKEVKKLVYELNKIQK